MKAKNFKIVYVVATFLMAILFSGCNKEQDTLKQNTSVAQIMSQTLPWNYDGYEPVYTDFAKGTPSDVRMRTFYYLPSITYYSIEAGGWITLPEVMFCALPKGTCFPTVVIVSERANDFCNTGRLFQDCYSQNRVSDFFGGDDYKIVFPEMDLMPSVLDSIKTGDISLHHFHNEVDSVDFYVGLPGNQNGHINLEEVDNLNVRCVLRIKNK